MEDFQKEHFSILQEELTNLKIQFEWDPYLVRGLDYYSDLCFEYIIKSPNGFAQNAVLAGGRYDGLYDHFGGPKSSQIKSVGFAMGIDRIVGIKFIILANLCILKLVL